MATFRASDRDDLGAIVALLTDDPPGQGREDSSDPPGPAYVGAFQAIIADPNQLLAVADADGVVGCMQISFIPGCRGWACGAARSKACLSQLRIGVQVWVEISLSGRLNNAGTGAVDWCS